MGCAPCDAQADVAGLARVGAQGEPADAGGHERHAQALQGLSFKQVHRHLKGAVQAGGLQVAGRFILACAQARQQGGRIQAPAIFDQAVRGTVMQAERRGQRRVLFGAEIGLAFRQVRQGRGQQGGAGFRADPGRDVPGPGVVAAQFARLDAQAPILGFDRAA
ncbi:hypothetical protein D3C86_1025700 [compost metagenome]